MAIFVTAARTICLKTQSECVKTVLEKHESIFLAVSCAAEKKQSLSQTTKMNIPGDLVQGLRENFRDGPSSDDGERFDLGSEAKPAATSRLW